MDICTLVLATVVTTQACWSMPTCQEYNGKNFCVAGMQTACKSPDPWWECTKKNGEKYTLKYTDGPVLLKFNAD